MPRVTTAAQQTAAREARALIAAYREVEPLVRVGAFEAGQDPAADRAVALHPSLTAFLRQAPADGEAADASSRLAALLA